MKTTDMSMNNHGIALTGPVPNVQRVLFAALVIFGILMPADLFPGDTDTAALIRQFSGRDDSGREYARSFIVKNKPADLLPVLKEIIQGRNDLAEKNAALEVLKLYPLQETLPLWIELLKNSPSFMVKKTIIDHIGLSGDRRIVMPLAKELSNPFSTVRDSAHLALRRIGDDRMLPHVLNMARDTSPIYRIYALEAMYYLYDRRMNTVLLEMLRDENKSVRYYVLKCIEKNRLIETLPQIRNIALSDVNWEVRIRALEVIREFNDKSAAYVLVKSVADSVRDVRLAAAQALRDLRIGTTAGPVSVQLAAEEDDVIKDVLIETLVRLRQSGGFAGLQRVMLSDKSGKLRVRAAFALGEIGDPRGVTLLLQGLNDPDFRVKAEAAYSLAAFRGIQHVVIKLLDVINDDPYLYVRTSALYALQRIGDRTMILPLFDLYGVETDPVFREKLRITLRRYLER